MIPFFKSTMLAVLIIPFFSTAAVAETTVYACQHNSSCVDERINFGTVHIMCVNEADEVEADWICEYEVEYSCRNTRSGAVRKGGFDPLTESLCDSLCDSCKGGRK